jgi:hypothetical protein
MSKTMEIDIKGLDKIENMLQHLPTSNAARIRRTALRKGARTLVASMREEVAKIPESSLSTSGKNRYKKSIAVFTKKGYAHVGPRKKDMPEAHFFEFGTAQRTNKAGQNRGAIKPDGSLRRAFERSKVATVDAIAAELVTETIKEAVKLTR